MASASKVRTQASATSARKNGLRDIFWPENSNTVIKSIESIQSTTVPKIQM